MTDEQISEIADELDCGFRCFIHKENKTLVVIPDEFNYPDVDTDAWENEIEEIDTNRIDYFEIEKMESHESFRVMEDFLDTVSDQNIQNKLRESLQRPKPFQNFKFDIDRSGPYRQKWFDFKKAKMMEWVREQIATAKI